MITYVFQILACKIQWFTVAALLINYPVSLALPSFIPHGRGLSLQDDEYEIIPGEEYPEDLDWEPSYEQELGRLKVYFSYLRVRNTFKFRINFLR